MTPAGRFSPNGTEELTNLSILEGDWALERTSSKHILPLFRTKKVCFLMDRLFIDLTVELS
jgi:hypothetical protein